MRAKAFNTQMRTRIASCFVMLFLASPVCWAVSNICLSGSCDITDPIYLNVYWDGSVAQWNSDIAANDGRATVAALDALTAAICHSAYFSQLKQYSVNSCTVLPGIVESGCGAVPGNLNQAHDQIGAFSTCVFISHPGLDKDRTILNVFLPPQVAPAAADSKFCSKAVGQHDTYIAGFIGGNPVYSPVPSTFLPTNSSCNAGLFAISATMTHEMVEATTDPIPGGFSGWKVPFDGEIGDQCNGATTPFLNGSVSAYHSNMTDGCVDGVSSAITFAPVISTVQACGCGRRMTILIQGNLGSSPWDLAKTPAGGSQTMFLQIAVSGSNNFTAGAIEPFQNDKFGLGPISWTSGPNGDSILIDGFDNGYGPTPLMQPGDVISVTVWSWLTGQSATGKVAVPGPTKIVNLDVQPDFVKLGMPIYFGDNANILGRVIDDSVVGTQIVAKGCPEEGIKVKLSATDPEPKVVWTATDTSDANGSFGGWYKTTGVAGTHTIKVESPFAMSKAVAVHPVAISLTGEIGGVAGGQPVTLKGDGFPSGTTKVSFRGPNASALATAVSVPDGQTVKFLTPPSPLTGQAPGLVDVVAMVNGQDSVALSYRYIIPNQPVLTFIPNACPAFVNQGLNTLEVDAYNADGSNAAETITLTAGYKAFQGANGFVSTFDVKPGALERMQGVGPVTATPSADHKLAVTEKFGPFIGTTSACFPDLTSLYNVLADLLGPDPVDTVVLPALTGANGLSTAWVDGANAGQASNYLVTGAVGLAAAAPAPAATPAPKPVEVRILGGRDLRKITLQQGFALAREHRGSRHLRLLGPNFAIRALSGASTATVWRTPAHMSFLVASDANTANYCIVHLTPSTGIWVEMKSTVAVVEGRASVHAAVTEAGTYALARIEK